MEADMRLSNSEHESHAWRIGEVAPDFRLEDAWALPAEGGANDFPVLLEAMASLDAAHMASRVARALFAVRYRIGEWLGWDEPPRPLAIPEAAETSLSARLPEDLRGSAAGVGLRARDFTPLYATDVECAAEVSNRTVHGVLHLAWVEQADGRYRGQMGVYVKPRGAFGQAYMAVIAPFRHLIVYPALMREIGRAWDARVAQRQTAQASAGRAAR
jgi:Protein of unknown function (DUF2867)